MPTQIRPLMIALALLGVGCARAEPQVARTERSLTASSAEEVPSRAEHASAEEERAPTPSEAAPDPRADSSNAAPAADTVELAVDSPESVGRYGMLRSRPRWGQERERVRRSGAR